MISSNSSIFMLERIKRPPMFQMEANHMHDYYELYYLLSGTRKYFIHHSFYTLHPHDMMLIQKGELHRTTYLSSSPHERTVLYFDDTWLQPLIACYGKDAILQCFSSPKLSIPVSKQDYLDDLLLRMNVEYQSKDIFSDRLLYNLFEELIIFLIRCREQQTEAYNYSQEADADISRAARYICENFHKDISLEYVAEISNLSPTYFSKKFKQTTGFGYKEYVNHIRLKEATRLLDETMESITTIAMQCGFNDSNYFGDVFKKTYGISPRTYRKKNLTLTSSLPK